MKLPSQFLSGFFLLLLLLPSSKTSSFRDLQEKYRFKHNSEDEKEEEIETTNGFTAENFEIINPRKNSNEYKKEDKSFSGCSPSCSNQGCIVTKICKNVDIPRIGSRELCKTQVVCS